ncbi:unnamed protein product [Paramecium sonneborni]|nr:unnamed protein product [Paramecium sonneborni]
MERELQDQQDKITRAENIMNSKLAKVQQKRIVLDESNAHISALELDIQNNLNKTLKTCIFNLVQEFPEMQAIIDAVFQEKNVTVPSKQPSSVGVPSVRSSVRSASSQGRR